MRDSRIQASEEEIAHSLEGNWQDDVLFELQQVVDAYDFHRKQVVACDTQLQKYMAALPSREPVGKTEPPVEAANSKQSASSARSSRRTGKPRTIDPASI